MAMESDGACVVRVLGGPDVDHLTFRGTGMLVAPAWVLTCKHVVDGPLLSCVVETATGQRVGVERLECAEGWDLALLKLTDELSGTIPRFLTGITRAVDFQLRAVRLEARGYAQTAPRQPPGYHTLGNVEACTYDGAAGTLTTFQCAGGLPEGCSGSPVLLPWEECWVYVGTTYLGGERAATSRVIAADRVAEFLTQAQLPTPPGVEASQVLAPREPAGVGARFRLPSPYRGLEAFREEDAGYFYGRGSETEQLLDRVRTQPFVALVGVSGSGKSSLIAAGVIPALRTDGRWLIAPCRPRLDPFGELAQALVRLLHPTLDAGQQKTAGQQLACRLRTARVRLAEVVAELTQAFPGKQLLLSVDQCEELYMQASITPDQQRLFLEQLVALVQQELPCTVLVTLREDFRHVLSDDMFAQLLNDFPPMFLTRMSKPALRDAIEQPAQQWGVTLEPRLAERILQDVGQEPGRLPLLQFALTALWARRSQEQLTHAAYAAIGGVEQALTAYANTVLAEFPGEGERLRRIFVQLVRPGEGTEETTCHVATRGQVGDTNWPLVLRLADKRLVVTGCNEQGQETVEVVHEVLFRHCPPLQRWMAQDREFRQWQNRLRQDLQDWETRARDPDALLRGRRLEEAEAMLHQHEEELPPQEMAYINASREQRDRVREAAEQDLREWIQLWRRSQRYVLLGLVPLCAGVMGTLPRMLLSYYFGSFIELPVWGSETAPSLGELFEPVWNGFFGTFVAGVYVVLASEYLLRENDRITPVQALWLATTGCMWGLTILLIVSVAFTPASLQAIGWYTHHMQFGFPITGTFWGFGIAAGTYIGDKVDRDHSHFSNVFRNRLFGGIGGVVCFSVVSPLVFGFFFQNTTSQHFMPRAWSDAFDQALSVCAILTCFYVLKRRLASTFAAFESARLRHR